MAITVGIPTMVAMAVNIHGTIVILFTSNIFAITLATVLILTVRLVNTMTVFILTVIPTVITAH